ncbi:hypothetical protein CsatB_024463 [Cannabis sativa]
MPEMPHVNKELGEDKCEYGMKKGFLVNTNAIVKDAAQLGKKSLESVVALNNKNLEDEDLMETVKTDVNKELENRFLVKTKISHKDATQPEKKSLESFVSFNNKNLDDEVLIETVKTDVNKELGEEKCECGMENGFLVKTKTSHKDATQPKKKSLESFVSLNNKNLDDEILIETMKTDVNKELGEEKCEYRMENGFVVKTKTSSDKDAAQPGKKSLESFVSLDNKNLDGEVLMETVKTDGKQSKGCVQLDEGSMEVLESKTSCGRKTKGNVPKRKHYRWKNSVVSDNFYDNHDGDDKSSPRNKVKELLFLFRKLLQEDADTKEERPCHRRVDYQIAKRLEDEKKILNTDLKLLGHVPGVEVGDAFKCRMELSILGLHRQTQSGISCSKHGGKNVAASIVASEDHTDDLDDSSVLVYTGQGGSTTNSDKKPEDQKLEGGNLALTNSMVLKTPIRVIRGCDPYKRRFRKFVYIGLYLVKSYKQVTGPHGNLVYKFWLERIPGQPEVVCKETERTRRLKTKKGVGLGDVSQGKVIPTSSMDTIDERLEAERFPNQPEAAQEVKLTNKSNVHKGVSLDDMFPGKEVVMPCGMDTKDGERPPPSNDETVKSIGEIEVAQKGVKRKRSRSRKGVCLDEEAIPMRDVNTKDDERPPSSRYKAIKSILDEPKAAQKGVKRRKRSESKKGVCLDDISHGKELIPIRAVNTIDDEKPPSFKYATNLVYPDWCHITPPKGCDCIDGCSDSITCSCAVKNGGEMPYSSNGTAVDGKLFLYECGPSCKCPPSCHNRVSQHGLKFKLEIFKTKLRGWGLRSRECIPLGGFICEYIGELLMDEEAEKRAGYDDYLFDIGKNHDSNTSIDEGLNNCEDVDDDSGFTIDAAEYGNVGRFINHSCSPNIYAQKILYDHEDESIPHIMFFAAEKIQPFEELTYDYHYVIDQVHDANGNIKKKSCFCGSRQCTGRLY